MEAGCGCEGASVAEEIRASLRRLLRKLRRAERMDFSALRWPMPVRRIWISAREVSAALKGVDSPLTAKQTRVRGVSVIRRCQCQPQKNAKNAKKRIFFLFASFAFFCRRTLADSGEAVAPDVVEEDGGFDVAEAVFGDFTLATFGDHRVHVPASDTVALR